MIRRNGESSAGIGKFGNARVSVNLRAMSTLAIEWFGTAAFRLSCGGTRILLDPYVSRNPYAKPATVARAGGIARADHVFLSHGHFDHVMDVPELLSVNPRLEIHGPARAIE